MSRQFEKKFLTFLLLFAIFATPISLMGKNYKKWSIIFLLNAYSNSFIAPVLAKKKYLQYPVRFLPRIYKSSIIYDYCLCSLVTVWYCRTSQKDNWKKAFLKVWMFSFPQALAEHWLERKTQLIKYNKGWTWIHSLLTITTAKLAVRYLYCLINWIDQTKKVEQQNENTLKK